MSALSKSAIDRLGERLKQAPDSKELLDLLGQYRLTFENAINQLRVALVDQCNVQSTARSKSTITIIDKLNRQPTSRLTQMQDIAGVRVIVKSCDQQNRLRDLLVSLYPSCKIVDRREKPSFGYRAVHLVITVENRLVELQIRTEAQHMWAALAESLADKFGHDLKYGGGDEEVKLFLQTASYKLNALEEKLPLSETDVINQFTEFLQNAIKELQKTEH